MGTTAKTKHGIKPLQLRYQSSVIFQCGKPIKE